MKRLFFLFTLLLPYFVQAQPAGRIVYEEKFNLHRGLGPGQESHKEMIPEFQVSKSQLLYDGQAALYGAYEEAEDVDIEPEEGMNIKIRRASNSVFYDYANGKQVEQRDFIGRLFIIESPAEKPEWKILPEQKSILGYPCQKAAYTNKDGQLVEAWFTPAIPAPIGPAAYQGLPGAVLMADVDGGLRIYQALSVELGGEKPLVEAPTKGKQISKEDYDKMVEERVREMGGTNQGGMIRIIRTN